MISISSSLPCSRLCGEVPTELDTPWDTVPLMEDVWPLLQSVKSVQIIAQSITSKYRITIRKVEILHFHIYLFQKLRTHLPSIRASHSRRGRLWLWLWELCWTSCPSYYWCPSSSSSYAFYNNYSPTYNNSQTKTYNSDNSNIYHSKTYPTTQTFHSKTYPTTQTFHSETYFSSKTINNQTSSGSTNSKTYPTTP